MPRPLPLTSFLVVATGCCGALNAHAMEPAGRYDSTGVVAPDRRVTLAAKIMGRVQHLDLDEGDPVSQGDVLLRLESLELQAELASAEASLSLAKTELAYKEKLETRMRRLYQAKTLSEERLDDATFDLAAARERVRIAKAAVEKARAALNETVLRAPFDGVITAKQAEVGQLTEPGATLLVLEDQHQVKFRTTVKEHDITGIEKGQSAVVTIDALGGKTLDGQVSKIIPSGDPKTHAFVVEIDLPAQEKLYPGMFGKASFGDELSKGVPPPRMEDNSGQRR